MRRIAGATYSIENDRFCIYSEYPNVKKTYILPACFIMECKKFDDVFLSNWGNASIALSNFNSGVSKVLMHIFKGKTYAAHVKITRENSHGSRSEIKPSLEYIPDNLGFTSEQIYHYMIGLEETFINLDLGGINLAAALTPMKFDIFSSGLNEYDEKFLDYMFEVEEFEPFIKLRKSGKFRKIYEYDFRRYYASIIINDDYLSECKSLVAFLKFVEELEKNKFLLSHTAKNIMLRVYGFIKSYSQNTYFYMVYIGAQNIKKYYEKYKQIIYCRTDSMHSTKRIKELDELIGDDIGCLKLRELSKCKYDSEHYYSYTDAGGKEHNSAIIMSKVQKIIQMLKFDNVKK